MLYVCSNTCICVVCMCVLLYVCKPFRQIVYVQYFTYTCILYVCSNTCICVGEQQAIRSTGASNVDIPWCRLYSMSEKFYLNPGWLTGNESGKHFHVYVSKCSYTCKKCSYTCNLEHVYNLFVYV